MNKSYPYTNINGVEFEITIEKGKVPEGVDYYGYWLNARVKGKDCVHTYKAVVKKTLCNDEAAADLWVQRTGIDFLFTILNTYKDGATTILLPTNWDWWVI